MPPMTQDPNTGVPFMKMHGLGNDFVVIDERDGVKRVSNSLVMAMADRHRGVGYDQLAVLGATDQADVHLTFYNSDGSTSGACGNATRCIARHLMGESGQSSLTLTTDHGTLYAQDAGDGLTSINMGPPQLDWRDIPLARDVDIDALPIDGAPLATGMGNPHCTFFVDNADAVDLDTRGAAIEHHPLYPQRTNVQFAHVVGENHLRMRVWERGVGVTLASGSSSCATAVAAQRKGLTGRTVRIDLDGGTIHIDWRDDGVWMTGPTAHVFTGVWHP
ncbi:diaminopimelate epimerase [Pseudooctadecabacter jejudonensis]|uniref:Diaminopimelate epimerase n=1 Tax=Pseudooctadecabacter jejudonensis TaxID=1391910 RepID=A0A1Y5S9A4_9RHOB|nr:diaminopimelate epimerase [Pseudooctadecabacter jejudonensis]SLN34708.1 Diaminopimelate epimerase [Pseudooctadecabacter jejudonensis]